MDVRIAFVQLIYFMNINTTIGKCFYQHDDRELIQ